MPQPEDDLFPSTFEIELDLVLWNPIPDDSQVPHEPPIVSADDPRLLRVLN